MDQKYPAKKNICIAQLINFLIYLKRNVQTSTFYQDEVQLARWVKTQITIFTAALWQKNKYHPAVVGSDDVSHSKQCILVFVRKILQSLCKNSVKTVHI